MDVGGIESACFAAAVTAPWRRPSYQIIGRQSGASQGLRELRELRYTALQSDHTAHVSSAARTT